MQTTKIFRLSNNELLAFLFFFFFEQVSLIRFILRFSILSVWPFKTFRTRQRLRKWSGVAPTRIPAKSRRNASETLRLHRKPTFIGIPIISGERVLYQTISSRVFLRVQRVEFNVASY